LDFGEDSANTVDWQMIIELMRMGQEQLTTDLVNQEQLIVVIYE